MNSFKTTSKLGFGPAIMDYFAAIPDNAFSYNYYNLRHPGGIYNLVTTRLITDIVILSNKIQNYSGDDMYPYFRIVLYDLFKFYDSCFEIMLCFAPIQPDKPETFVDRWLGKKKYDYATDFINSINADPEIKILKTLYNKLKHTSNEIRFLTVNYINGVGFGYWLEIANERGGVKPEESQDFPISLTREIRRVQYIIYKLSDTLFEVLKIHVIKHFPNSIYTEPLVVVQDSFFYYLNETINTMPDFYLLNEKGKLFYKADFIKNKEGSSVKFSKETITDHMLDKYFDENVSGTFIGSGDGYTKEFTYPHMGLPSRFPDWQVNDRSQNPSE